jgi:3-oxoacyl-[acyl-carrier protein] reductase
MEDGRVAVVTGGGTGIGRAAALDLARAGFAVLVSGRRPEMLDEVCQGITAAGGRASALAGDVADPRYCDALSTAAVRQFGRVDALVTAAAICESAEVTEVSADDWDRTLTINLRGSALCARAVARAMRNQGDGGRIVLIASINGVTSEPESAPYSASKAGIISLARSLAVDLARDRIAANAVAPGWVHTAMTDGWLAAATPEQVERLNPVGRLGLPEEIASVITYLAADAPLFLTGTTVLVDGGQTAVAPLP